MLTQDHIQTLTEFNNKTQPNRGYNYVIIVKNEDGEIELHKRECEPCYGGLRKYQSTHKNEATQPENKPGDLRKPFPKGEPIALSFPFPEMRDKEYDKMFEFLWGPESPWLKGFEGPEKLIYTHYEDKTALNGRRSGVILTSTDIDPTVLVNLCKFCHAYSWTSVKKFNNLLEEGLTPFEAICAICFDNRDTYYPHFANGYMFTFKPDLKRFKNKEPNNFSIGTLRQRFDYSRNNIQDLFKSDDKDQLQFSEAIRLELAAAGGNNGSVKGYAEAVKKVVNKYV